MSRASHKPFATQWPANGIAAVSRYPQVAANAKSRPKAEGSLKLFDIRQSVSSSIFARSPSCHPEIAAWAAKRTPGIAGRSLKLPASSERAAGSIAASGSHSEVICAARRTRIGWIRRSLGIMPRLLPSDSAKLSRPSHKLLDIDRQDSSSDRHAAQAAIGKQVAKPNPTAKPQLKLGLRQGTMCSRAARLATDQKPQSTETYSNVNLMSAGQFAWAQSATAASSD